jgi:hypothetical protein
MQLMGGNLNCGTDGGLRINKGTFGLVISVEDKIIWEGCGPKVVMNIVFMSQVRDVVLPSEGSWIGVG